MARRKHHRSSRKNIIDQSVSVVKTTSKRYMPKVKSSLENVGSNVIRTGEKSIPFLQNLTRKFFSLFSSKTRRRRKH